MSDNVVTLEPHTAALFYSTDDLPKIAVALCNERTLVAAVVSVMFPSGVQTPADREQLSDYVTALRETGKIDFEDGWLELCSGMHAVVVFLLEQLKQACENERFADERRYKELHARKVVKEKYDALVEALIEALGDRAPTIVQIAAGELSLPSGAPS